MVRIVLGLFVLRPAILRPVEMIQGQQKLDESKPLSNSSLDLPASVITETQGHETEVHAADPLPVLEPVAVPEMAVGEFAFQDTTPLPPPPPIPVDAEAVARLRGLITERREETLEVLRSWMETVDDRDSEGVR